MRTLTIRFMKNLWDNLNLFKLIYVRIVDENEVLVLKGDSTTLSMGCKR